MSTLDWLIVAAYFTAIAALTSWVLKRRRDTADDYFLASRHLGWFVGRVHLRLQHRLRAPGRTGWRGSDERRRAGALRAARLVSPHARVGDGAVLRPHHGVHHAGVLRAALLPRGPLRALDHLARGLRADQAGGRHLRRWGGVRRAATRAADRRLQPLLVRSGGGAAADRSLHRLGGDAGR